MKLIVFNTWGGSTLPLLFTWEELEDKHNEITGRNSDFFTLSIGYETWVLNCDEWWASSARIAYWNRCTHRFHKPRCMGRHHKKRGGERILRGGEGKSWSRCLIPWNGGKISLKVVISHSCKLKTAPAKSHPCAAWHLLFECRHFGSGNPNEPLNNSFDFTRTCLQTWRYKVLDLHIFRTAINASWHKLDWLYIAQILKLCTICMRVSSQFLMLFELIFNWTY